MFVSKIKFLKDDSCSPHIDSAITYSNDNIIINQANIGNHYDKENVDQLIEESLIKGSFRFSEDDGVPIVNISPMTFYKKNINTNGSEITVDITRNGDSSGIPIFNSLSECIINAHAERDTTSVNEAPWVYIKSIINSSITFRIMRSNSGAIILGGIYDGNVGNDNSVVVHITIIGIKNMAS